MILLIRFFYAKTFGIELLGAAYGPNIKKSFILLF